MKIKKYFIGLLFFLSACASGSSLVEKNVIKPGMTKLDLNFVLAYRSFWEGKSFNSEVKLPTKKV